MPTGSPDYYKTALLAGMYGTTPVLAYITDDGRFVMRLEDWPDQWDEAASMGLAELAAILSPVKRFDRRGQVVHWDSFDSGFVNSAPETNGTGASATIDGTRSRTGSHCVKLVAGSDGDRWASVYHAIPYVIPSRVGIEVSFVRQDNIESVVLSCSHDMTLEEYRFNLRYRPPEHDISYLNEDGNYTIITDDIYLSTDGRLFHTMKVVFDMTSHNYVRWMLDSHSGDLTGISGQHVVTSASPAITARIEVYGLAGTNAVMYVDDLIYTQQEPE